MSRRPNLSETMARKAAAAVEMIEDEPAPAVEAPRRIDVPEEALQGGPLVKGRGRPKGKREVGARMTVYLDSARHEALVRLANDRGRSVHSLILEGIDTITEKPSFKAWQ